MREIIAERYSPARYNVYLFYASDGDNSPSDRDAAAQACTQLRDDANYCGYLESPVRRSQRHLTTETARHVPRASPAAATPVGMLHT